MANMELILNLVWVLLSVSAVVGQVWMNRLRSGVPNRRIDLRSLSVLIVTLALFPTISASDDRMYMADLFTAPSHGVVLESGQMHRVLALLEDSENGQITEPLCLIAIVCLFLIARFETGALARWIPISAVGRAPPSLA